MKQPYTCPQCDVVFNDYPCNERKFCSRKCYELGKRKQTLVDRTCNRCHKTKHIEDFSIRKKDGLTEPICKSCQVIRNRSYSRTIQGRLTWSRYAAKKRNLQWELTDEDYGDLIIKPCEYCGSDLNPSGCGLDRKCNDIGYCKDNVVPCCKICNVVKNDFFTYEEMLILAPALRSIHSKRKSDAISDAVL